MQSTQQILQIVNREIENLVHPEQPSELYAPISYTMALGGKRLRPVLCLHSCDMFGGDISKAIMPALGIEMFHNFTLVHDDIMDNAPVRRGHPTVYKKWNTNIAILSGDTMFAKAYELVAESDPPILQRILKVFTQTAIEVCEGQQYDMNFESMADVSIPDYLMMIRLKTAVLIAASLKVGALVAGAPDEDAANVYAFGENIGMTFQLQDDFLDVYSDPDVFGKQTGGDIATNKKTYLILKALEEGTNQQKNELRELFHQVLEENATKISRVKEIYSNIGIHRYTKEMMLHYYHNAIGFLDKISLSQERKIHLRTFANNLMERNY
ncbi:MAG: polyprenyl synthetase family protein [Bacteroidetes bacterium]|nr:polyprenyl synthetase family protein [Bacteroidota bacterium]MBU1717720.1 polyprenyl synthetase family protein [Bacteroidota bacterium]